MSNDNANLPRPDLDDNQLLKKHLDGDALAFGHLIERFRQELYAFLARFTGDGHLAEDVFQETFLQLHASASTFDMSKRLKPWLYTIAANKARDALRKRARRPAASLDVPLDAAGDSGRSHADLLEGKIPEPDEISANQETRRLVKQVISEMPENLRDVLILAYFQQLPYKDIADVVGAPLGTVKSRLHSAVREFAARWQRTVGPNHDR
jgi:RNA polymerase sigma-70 factor (ECF subfamily)